MKTKLFHVCPNFYPIKWGIESFVLESSKELAKIGYDVTVVTGNKTQTGKKLAPKETVDGIKIRRFPFKKFSRYNTSVAALKFLLSSDFDILHVHGIGFFTDSIPVIKIETGQPIVLSTHGGIFHTKSFRIFKKFYFNTFTRLSMTFVDKILASSKQDSEFMKKIADRKKITTIGNGIYWSRFGNTKNRGNGRTLVYLGRLSRTKRIDRALKVLARVKEKIPDVKLLIIGEDWGEKRNLMGAAGKLGLNKNVKFVGYASEKQLLNYLSKSDVFLLPSEYEGFGISVIVAMASGLPVVASRIQTMQELIVNGRNGFLVDYDNTEKTAHAIGRLLSNKKMRVNVGSNARKFAKKYDWSNMVRILDKTYKQLL